MRKIVSGLFISLDGVVEAPNEWQFDHFDEDMAEGMTAHLATEDTLLMGRVTYQEWADYWPKAGNEDGYAVHINHIPKYVVSTTLDKVAWGDLGQVQLVKGNLAAELDRLKRQPGKNIGIGGSPTLVRSLLDQGLLDELMLMVHPVVVGHGKRLFKDGSALKRMKLLDSQMTRTGVAILTYEPIRDAPMRE